MAVGDKKVILGVDPGFSVTGYSLMVKEGSRAYLLDCGFLKMSSKDHLSQRTLEFHDFFKKIIEEKGVSHVSLETSFLGKNPQTFLKLGYLRGILYLLAAQHKLEIAEFAPREVKQAIVGSGSADKEQVALMLMRMFPQLQQYSATLRNDVTDAIAIGICGMCLFN